MDEKKEETKVSIPESITLGGVTYYVKDTPELRQFIQDVAKVEKAKLYSQFENLKAQISNLGKVNIVGKEQFDIDRVVEKMKGVFVTKEDLMSTLPNIIKEVVQPVLTATEENRKNELHEYREKLIKENIATCIPDLVRGETKEELDNSLKESIRLREAYPSPSSAGVDNKPVTDPLVQKQLKELEATMGKEPPTPQPQKQTSQVPPLAPRRQSPEATGVQSNVRQMSMAEFAQNRDALKAQLASLYGEN